MCTQKHIDLLYKYEFRWHTVIQWHSFGVYSFLVPMPSRISKKPKFKCPTSQLKLPSPSFEWMSDVQKRNWKIKPTCTVF